MSRLTELARQWRDFELGIDLQDGSRNLLTDLLEFRKPRFRDQVDFFNYHWRMLMQEGTISILLPHFTEEALNDFSQRRYLLAAFGIVYPILVTQAVKYSSHRLFNCIRNRFGEYSI